ncbi:MAG: hypothetical protein AB1414_05575 [bacterium]
MCKRIFLGLMIVGVCILTFGTYRLSNGNAKKDITTEETNVKSQDVKSEPIMCEIPIPEDIKVNLQYTGELKLGNIITLKATAIPKYDVSDMRIVFGYNRYGEYMGGGIRYLGSREIKFGLVKKDEMKEASVSLIIEKGGEYWIGVSANGSVPGRPNGYYRGGESIPKFYLYDPEYEAQKAREAEEQRKAEEFIANHPEDFEDCELENYYSKEDNNFYYRNVFIYRVNGKVYKKRFSKEVEDKVVAKRHQKEHLKKVKEQWEEYLNKNDEIAMEIDKIQGLSYQEKVQRYEEEMEEKRSQKRWNFYLKSGNEWANDVDKIPGLSYREKLQRYEEVLNQKGWETLLRRGDELAKEIDRIQRLSYQKKIKKYCEEWKKQNPNTVPPVLGPPPPPGFNSWDEVLHEKIQKHHEEIMKKRLLQDGKAKKTKPKTHKPKYGDEEADMEETLAKEPPID